MSHGHIDIMGGQSGIRYPIGSIGHLPNDVADDRFRDPKRDGPYWVVLVVDHPGTRLTGFRPSYGLETTFSAPVWFIPIVFSASWLLWQLEGGQILGILKDIPSGYLT